MGKLQTFVDLFGPEPRPTGTPEALVGTNGTSYDWPGGALSASTVYFRFDQTLNSLYYCRWLLVWIPYVTGVGVQLIYADPGPANITQIAEFTGLSGSGAIPSAVDITTSLNNLISGGVAKQIGHRTKGDGNYAPLIFASRLEMVWNV